MYDATALYLGAPPSANNLGSFSVQPYPGSASYIHLLSWTDPDLATNWQAFYLAYDAAGVAHAQPGMSPGPSWENLPLNHWYRFRTVVDFDLNQIVEVGITDIATGLSDTYVPADWYLEGGEAGGAGTPTGFRLFAGGGVAGNVTAWDNVSIRRLGCTADTNDDGQVDVVDLLAVLAAWGGSGGPEDINCDGVVNVLDLLELLSQWGPC
jgi:hypothetical protein